MGVKRLTYKGKMYRYCKELIDLYGEVPNSIKPLPSWVNSHRNDSKLLVAKDSEGKVIKIFSHFPTKYKDKYYYSYIYKKPDKEGIYWDFVPRKDKI